MLRSNYAVIFLSRSGAKRPFHWRVETDGLGVLDLLRLDEQRNGSGVVVVREGSAEKVAGVLREYQKVWNADEMRKAGQIR